jgi:hypothetical protein
MKTSFITKYFMIANHLMRKHRNPIANDTGLQLLSKPLGLFKYLNIQITTIISAKNFSCHCEPVKYFCLQFFIYHSLQNQVNFNVSVLGYCKKTKNENPSSLFLTIMVYPETCYAAGYSNITRSFSTFKNTSQRCKNKFFALAKAAFA